MDQGTYDVIIIGGGPAGVTTAIYTARADLSTLVLDKGLRTGAMGLASKMANWPGVQGVVEGAAILQTIRDQAAGFGAVFVQDHVLNTDLSSNPMQVWSSKGLYQARTLVIASGAMGRTETIPGEERLLGRGVSYCAICDAAFFRGQEVAVIGSTQEAAEEALLLTQFVDRVHLLCQTPELRVEEDLAGEVAAHDKITFYPSARLREIVGDEEVEGLRWSSKGGEIETLPVKGAFVYLQGGQPITDFVAGQVATTEHGCIEVDDIMQTTIPGVFAVGDVLCTHIKQAIISAGEGAIAGIAVQRYLSGRKNLRPDWS